MSEELSTNSLEQKHNKTKIGAGAAGAGGGTLLVAMANSLPNDSPWKSILLHAAPTITVISSALVATVIYECRKFLRQRQIQQELLETRKAIAASLTNPDTSDNHKAAMRKKLENIENLHIDNKLKNIQTLMAEDGCKASNSLKPSATRKRRTLPNSGEEAASATQGNS